MPYLLIVTEFIIINNPVLQLQFIGQITVINFLFWLGCMGQRSRVLIIKIQGKSQLYLFSCSVVIDYHKFNDLRHHKYILQSWGSEIPTSM